MRGTNSQIDEGMEGDRKGARRGRTHVMGGSSLRAVSQEGKGISTQGSQKDREIEARKRHSLLALLDVLREPLETLEQTLTGGRATEKRSETDSCNG